MMKGAAFQLVASSLALALMAGAAGIHWWHVDSAGSRGADWQSLVVKEDMRGAVPVSTGGPVVRGEVATKEEMNATVETLKEMISTLKDMKEESGKIRDENEDLREQLKEANRGMTELEMRVDMNSEGFRPLKLKPTPQGVFDTGHPLLGPKRR